MKISASLLEVLARKPAPDPALTRAWETGEVSSCPARGHNRAQRRYEGRFTRRRYQRSPDRERSLQRRRQLAASGHMPPRMAARLTTGEQAVARIIVDEIATNGRCELCLDAIAARSGVCLKTAQRALRRLGAGKHTPHEKIVGLDWIAVEFRPVGGGRKNLPNVVTIVSAEWLTWIARGPIRPRISAGHFGPATVNVLSKSTSPLPTEPWNMPKEAIRGVPEAKSRSAGTATITSRSSFLDSGV